MKNKLTTNKLIKFISGFIKYVFENGPNAAFWLVILIGGYNWFSKSPLLVRISIGLMSIIALYILARNTFKFIKSKTVKALIESAASGVTPVTKLEDRIPMLLESVPSAVEMKAIYTYAKDYARTWSSDGKFDSLCYYIEYESNKVKHNIQIFISSDNRSERLTTYFPSQSKSIEEIKSPNSGFEIQSRAIYSVIGWRNTIKRAIESRSSDIEKAENVSFQISTTAKGLHIYATFSVGDRKWYYSEDINNS